MEVIANKNKDFYIILKLALCAYISWMSTKTNISNALIVSFILIFIIMEFLKGIFLNKHRSFYKIILTLQLIGSSLFAEDYRNFNFTCNITLGSIL